MIGLAKADVDTPLLWVDLDRLEQNIATLARHFRQAGVHWRPHTKGIKIPAIAHKLMAAGAIGVTCAKLSEAEVMVAAGIKEILIANQVTGKLKLPRLANLCRQADVKVAVDNPQNVAALGAAATHYGAVIGVLIELNCGMERAGVQPGEPVLALVRLITQTPGLKLRGLMSWEGHTLDLADPAQKRQAIERSIELVTSSADLCRRHGIPIEIVSGGGSGTYQVTPFLTGMTEIQAGGAIFCDVTYQSWGVDLQPALFVQTTVTSRPNPRRIICDAGFKALPSTDGAPAPLGLAQKVAKVISSAEHGALELDSPNETLMVGDLLDFVVGYGDGTVYLHEMMVGVRNGIVECAWPILGRGKLQ
ncbi:MAG: DSD1 family PLP-dependent enzyme [Caldilinea sp. CFX5]|nr:DSD1 family PLP-dependent enzyme [Caldilinea sp. CFX5]